MLGKQSTHWANPQPSSYGLIMKNIAFGLRVGIVPSLVWSTGAFRVVSEDLSVIPRPLHSVCTGQDDSVHISILF